MTPDEKHAQRQDRDKAIIVYYLAGHSLRQCASKFTLGRQRTLDILKAANVWTPYRDKSPRTKFLGVSVTPETKDAVKAEAIRRGVSASEVADDALQRGLEKTDV